MCIFSEIRIFTQNSLVIVSSVTIAVSSMSSAISSVSSAISTMSEAISTISRSVSYGNRGGSIYWGSISWCNNWTMSSCDGCNWSSVGTCDDSCSWCTSSGSRFIGFDCSAESMSISNVVYYSGSSINVMQSVRSLFVSVSISYFWSWVSGSQTILDVISESIVSVSL